MLLAIIPQFIEPCGHHHGGRKPLEIRARSGERRGSNPSHRNQTTSRFCRSSDHSPNSWQDGIVKKLLLVEGLKNT
jgi:hypothetical protein